MPIFFFVYQSTTKSDYKEVECLQNKMTLSALSLGNDSLIRMPRRVNFRSVGLNGIVQNFTDTLENIKLNVLFGTGFGSNPATHNSFLQLFSELGLLGLLFFLLVFSHMNSFLLKNCPLFR